MPDIQFRDSSDSTLTVKDAQGNVLFTADVLEINAFLAIAQREAGAMEKGTWLQSLGRLIQQAYGLSEPPSPYNCSKLAVIATETVKRLKNEDGPTPIS